MLNDVNTAKVNELRNRYPTAQALVLPVLWIVQEQEGYISEDSMKYVAALLGLPFGHILGVVTFYTMLHSKPTGKHHIEIFTKSSLSSRERFLQICDGALRKPNAWARAARRR